MRRLALTTLRVAMIMRAVRESAGKKLAVKLLLIVQVARKPTPMIVAVLTRSVLKPVTLTPQRLAMSKETAHYKYGNGCRDQDHGGRAHRQNIDVMLSKPCRNFGTANLIQK